MGEMGSGSRRQEAENARRARVKGDVTLMEVVNFLLRHRRLLFATICLPFGIVVIGRSFVRQSYTSSASFMPQAADRAAGLASLAAQFGIGALGKGDNQSPAFYADLLKSREVMQAVLEATYVFPTDTGEAKESLLQSLDIDADTPELRLERALKRMESLLTVNLQLRTGVVAFEVSAPNADLSRQVAERLLDEVSRFNLERRQTQAGAERLFNEQRLVELRGELRQAEDRLQTFLQRNRDYRHSPELSFQQDRLARDVALRQAVYTTVAQAYEQARMEQVRDTPVITVIERPDLPARPDGRGRIRYGLIAIICGGLVGLSVAMLREYRDSRRASGDPEYAVFATLWAATRRDLRGLWPSLWSRRNKA